MRSHVSVVLAGLLFATLELFGSVPADAVVGRPLTPMSVAGVSRRTARRTTRRNVYGYGYGAGTAYGYAGAAVATGTIAALPGGCGFGGGIYTCGAVRYRPYYQGATVVYVPM